MAFVQKSEHGMGAEFQKFVYLLVVYFWSSWAIFDSKDNGVHYGSANDYSAYNYSMMTLFARWMNRKCVEHERMF